MIKKVWLLGCLIAVSAHIMAQDSAYSLQECVKIALENNLSIQRSRLDKQSSEIGLTQSKMNRYPNLNLNSSYGSNWGRSIDPTTNQFLTQKINSAGLGGQSALTLFNGFQISNAIKQSKINLEAAYYDLENAKDNVSLSVITLYLNTIFNKELVGNASFQLNSTTEQLERTKTLVDAGALPITNLLDLQAQQASNEVNLINAENNYNFALLQLKQALLIPASDAFEIEVPNIQIEYENGVDEDAGQVYNTALANQPQIKSADLRIKESELGYDIAKSGYMPSLTLNGSFRTNYSGAADRQRQVFSDQSTIVPTPIGYLESNPGERVFRDLVVPVVVDTDPDFTLPEQFDENLSKSISLNISIPVFNNWRTRSDVQRSLINQRRAEINAQETRDQLRQTIETSTNDLSAASKSYTASEKQVKALQESYRIIENQYNLGAVNFVDFQVSVNNLFIAKSDLVRAKYDYIFKRKVLDFYLGKPLSF